MFVQKNRSAFDNEWIPGRLGHGPVIISLLFNGTSRIIREYYWKTRAQIAECDFHTGRILMNPISKFSSLLWYSYSQYNRIVTINGISSKVNTPVACYTLKYDLFPIEIRKTLNRSNSENNNFRTMNKGSLEASDLALRNAFWFISIRLPVPEISSCKENGNF